MQCFVYASQRKPNTYVWLHTRDGFDVLPEPLTLMLGELRLAMELELDDSRRLPQEDAKEVLADLAERGWHLQIPPGDTLAVGNQHYRGPLRETRDETRE
ncbi:MAG TPA: YcgL domain-containing protein [Pinirhizobacter sp.]|uniref:YcgL domain-containing protein n=1 Tax=Pinirhizobacter sp. TaxID=2950432 RepID=UPI002B631713|nr:YcgL domain-containing protein [Pinirhizobacter sp.]HMH68723.1 YcgL domain-containing protein [Pinirhizobacter sp.]